MDNQNISLDALYKEAKAAVRHEKAAKAKAGPVVVDPLTEGLYRNPANWIAGRYVVLIHEETGTALGAFQELRHRTVADARRLVRVEVPVSATSAVEYVKGDWWITKHTPVTPKRAWHVNIATLISLDLLSLGVCALNVPILACFGEGRLERVELLADTPFVITKGSAEFLILPLGTNVINMMSAATTQDLKIKLEQPE